MIPYLKLHKQYTELSLHHVWEAIAAKILSFRHKGQINPADILSKHWEYQQVKDSLQVLLIHKGDTEELFKLFKTFDSTYQIW